MKIALFDPYKGKFTQDMEDWWNAHGYEVKRDTYYDPKLVEWADVVWFHTCDNNIKSACFPDPNDPTMAGWDLHGMDLAGKKIIVQPIDIEVWYGHQYNVDWNLITDTVFIAKHIQELANGFEGLKGSSTKQHLIPYGVNLERYTYREHSPGYNIGIVSEIWESKGSDLVPQIVMKLQEIDPRYNIKWLGKWSEYPWDKAYLEDFIERNNLNIEFIEWVDSVDDFLEDKDYLLHCTKKEAFSFATAEAMAKGIMPILHHFYGAEYLWPGITWQTIDEAVEMIIRDKNDWFYYPGNNRYWTLDYLEGHGYTTNQMMEQIETVIHG